MGIGILATTGCSTTAPNRSVVPCDLVSARPGAFEDHQALGLAPSREPERNWHIDLGFRTGYTKLASTKQKLDRRLDLPMKLDVFNVFGNPTTPLDRKSTFGLNTLYFGVGRREKDWVKWTCFVGGGGGADKTHKRFANANVDVAFKYAYYYTGLTLELYPWGTPKHAHDLDWRARLRASRPYLLTGAELGYVSAEGRGRFALAPITLYEDKQVVRDWLFSGLLGIGWGIPVNHRWSINLSGHYSAHLYRPQEYNTWNIVSVLRYEF